MTVIAGLLVGQIPALVGDILLTSDGSSEEEFHTPLVRDANASIDDALYTHVSGLRQKVNILSDKVMVAWSGKFVHAYSLIAAIDRELKKGCTPEDIPDFIHKFTDEDVQHASLIGVARGEKQTRFFWRGAVSEYDSQLYSRVIAAGTGADDLAALIRRMDQTDLASNQGLSEYGRIVLSALSLSGQVAGVEHLTQLNLQMGWGGCLETAVFSDGSATKIGEILYAMWHCRKIRDGHWTFRVVPTFVKLEYQDGLLVVQTISETESPRVAVIPPVLTTFRKGDRIAFRGLTWSYDWLCSCVVFEVDGKFVDVLSTVQSRRKGTPIGFVREQRLKLPGQRGSGEPAYSSKFTASVDRQYHHEMAEIAGARIGPGTTIELVGRGAG